MRPFFAVRAKKPLHTGVRTGCHHLISLVCLCACATFVVFTDCESCTRPISTNPGSMEAGEYGLTRGTCFVASHLEVSPGCCGFRGVFWVRRFFSYVFFFSFIFVRKRTACCKYEAALPYLPLCWYRDAYRVQLCN